jgi:low affinity Fe/Cu permease
MSAVNPPSKTKAPQERRSPLRLLNVFLERFSHYVTLWSGSSWAFGLAVLVIVVWVVTGPVFNYSDTWQLVINTGTTIVTFLMVFLIQRSQNKESLAVQVKLNELLASQQGASNRLINVEDLSEEQINDLHERFSKLSEKLTAAADDCEQHSIVEARDAAAEAEATLDDAQQAVSEEKQRRGQVDRDSDALASA